MLKIDLWEVSLVTIPTTTVTYSLDLADSPSQVYVLHGNGTALKQRRIAISHDAAHNATLVIEDRPAAESPGLSGVTMPRTSMPVPGRENVDGKSEHYVFHYDDRSRLVYRTIATAHAAPYTITLVTKDRDVPSHWVSWAKVGRPAAIATVPGRENADGNTEQYVFHYDHESQLMYRTTSVSRDAAHGDALVTDDRLVANWWKASMKGVDRLAEIVPVPGPGTDGEAAFWVFHFDSEGRLVYRKISIKRDAAHGDALMTEDRVVADWWKASLKGVGGAPAQAGPNATVWWNNERLRG